MTEVDTRLLRVLSATPEQPAAIDRILAGQPLTPGIKMSSGVVVARIVSGGQIGAERAALDWAIANGVAHGGWCPRGRKTLDLWKIPPKYAVKEVRSRKYSWEYIADNVRDSDATVIFTLGPKIPHPLERGG